MSVSKIVHLCKHLLQVADVYAVKSLLQTRGGVSPILSMRG